MTSSARKDVIIGASVIAIAALLIFVVFPLGIDLPTNTESRALAPDFWPIVIAAMAAFAGLCMAVNGFLHRDAPTPPNHPAKIASGVEKGARVLSAFGAMILCYFLAPTLGLVLCTVFLCAGLMWLGGERRWPIVIGVAVTFPVLLFLFFNGFAGVPIPTGIFEGLLDGTGL